MKSYIGGLLFALGFVTGGAVGWYLTKDKASEKINFEMQEMQRYYKNLYAEKEKTLNKEIEKQEAAEEVRKEYEASENASVVNRAKPNISDFARTSTKDDVKYSTFYQQKEPNPAPADIDPEAPYIVEPEDQEENEEYNKIGLHWFTDGIIAEQDGSIVEEPLSICGEEFIDHFRKHPEEDSVWVRNDRLKCYYEMCRSAQTYKEYMGTRPKPVKIK